MTKCETMAFHSNGTKLSTFGATHSAHINRHQSHGKHAQQTQHDMCDMRITTLSSP